MRKWKKQGTKAPSASDKWNQKVKLLGGVAGFKVLADNTNPENILRSSSLGYRYIHRYERRFPTSVCLSPVSNGRHIAIGFSNGLLEILDQHTGQAGESERNPRVYRHSFCPHGAAQITCLKFSNDGSRLAVGLSDGSLFCVLHLHASKGRDSISTGIPTASGSSSANIRPSVAEVVKMQSEQVYSLNVLSTTFIRGGASLLALLEAKYVQDRLRAENYRTVVSVHQYNVRTGEVEEVFGKSQTVSRLLLGEETMALSRSGELFAVGEPIPGSNTWTVQVYDMLAPDFQGSILRRDSSFSLTSLDVMSAASPSDDDSFFEDSISKRQQNIFDTDESSNSLEPMLPAQHREWKGLRSLRSMKSMLDQKAKVRQQSEGNLAAARTMDNFHHSMKPKDAAQAIKEALEEEQVQTRACAFPTIWALKAITFSWDEKMIASIDEENEVVVYSIETNEEYMRLRSHENVEGIYFCPCNDRMVVVSSKKKVRNMAAERKTDSSSNSDGQSCGLFHVSLYRLSSGVQLQRFRHYNAVPMLDVGTSWLAIISGNQVICRHLGRLSSLRCFETTTLVEEVAMSPFWNWVAISSPDLELVEVYPTKGAPSMGLKLPAPEEKWRRKAAFPCPGPARLLRFSQNGGLLAFSYTCDVVYQYDAVGETFEKDLVNQTVDTVQLVVADVANSKVVRQYESKDGLSDHQFVWGGEYDAQLLLAVGDQVLSWNITEQDSKPRVVADLDSPVRRLVVHGNLVLAACEDGIHTIYIVGGQPQVNQHVLGAVQDAHCIDLREDGKLAALAKGNRITLLSVPAPPKGNQQPLSRKNSIPIISSSTDPLLPGSSKGRRPPPKEDMFVPSKSSVPDHSPQTNGGKTPGLPHQQNKTAVPTPPPKKLDGGKKPPGERPTKKGGTSVAVASKVTPRKQESQDLGERLLVFGLESPSNAHDQVKLVLTERGWPSQQDIRSQVNVRTCFGQVQASDYAKTSMAKRVQHQHTSWGQANMKTLAGIDSLRNSPLRPRTAKHAPRRPPLPFHVEIQGVSFACRGTALLVAGGIGSMSASRRARGLGMHHLPYGFLVLIRLGQNRNALETLFLEPVHFYGPVASLSVHGDAFALVANRVALKRTHFKRAHTNSVATFMTKAHNSEHPGNNIHNRASLPNSSGLSVLDEVPGIEAFTNPHFIPPGQTTCSMVMFGELGRLEELPVPSDCSVFLAATSRALDQDLEMPNPLKLHQVVSDLVHCLPGVTNTQDPGDRLTLLHLAQRAEVFWANEACFATLLSGSARLELAKDSTGETALQMASRKKLRWAVSGILKAVLDRKVSDETSLFTVTETLSSLINNLADLVPDFLDAIEVTYAKERDILGIERARLTGIAVKGSEEQFPFHLWSHWNSEKGSECDVTGRYLLLPGLAQYFDEFSQNPLHALVLSGQKSKKAFETQAVKALLEYKWNSYGKRIFRWDLKLYCFYLLCWTALCMLLPGVPRTFGFLPWTQDKLYYISRATLLIAVAGCNFYYAFTELTQISKLTPKLYFRSIWNFFDIAAIIMVMLILPIEWLHDGNCYDGTKQSICYFIQFDMAVASVILCTKLLYFLRGFDKRGFLFSLIVYVLMDMSSFFSVLIVFLFGFSLAFYALTDKSSTDNADEVSVREMGIQYGKQFMTLFGYMLGDFVLDDLYDEYFWWLLTILFIAYMTTIAIIFFNVLIAVISESFDRIMAESEMLSNLEKAVLIVEKERVMSKFDLEKFCPRWIHVLYPLESIGEMAIRNKEEEGSSWSARLNRVKGYLAWHVSSMSSSIVQDLSKEIGDGLRRLECKIDAVDKRQRAREADGFLRSQTTIPETDHEHKDNCLQNKYSHHSPTENLSREDKLAMLQIKNDINSLDSRLQEISDRVDLLSSNFDMKLDNFLNQLNMKQS